MSYFNEIITLEEQESVAQGLIEIRAKLYVAVIVVQMLRPLLIRRIEGNEGFDTGNQSV